MDEEYYKKKESAYKMTLWSIIGLIISIILILIQNKYKLWELI